MQQIADAAGVSKMTVSRALKNHPHVSAAVRDRITQLASKLGYRTHPYVSALMSGLTQTRKAESAVNLAVFHFDELALTLGHSYYIGVSERARELGYRADPFAYDPSQANPARLRSILTARGIRGIIIMPAPAGLTSLDFDFSGFATATIGHTIVDPPLPRVASDIYSGTIDALNELVRRGYTRIGMISTDYVDRLANFLYSAAMATCRDHIHLGTYIVEYTIRDPIGSPASLEHMKQWILAEKLEVVVCPNFDLPLYDILKDLGFDIPGQLSYLHLIDYSDHNVSRHVNQLEHLGEFIGAKAVDVVTAMINRNEFNAPVHPPVVGIRTQWREGQTAPFLKKAVVPPKH